ncbi:Alpha-2,8-sialyltransferase 8B [Holothuria leucospilota]|uniref:Alpha-2,8-sialyltransferase 8B n=1 Tax=Holothuria leucospilota TaxID=206669 RepID=A0A9Q1HL16_HOLLE|nr:Alpha-2,8-sialyltransferase 8B [Holothuria leucospilota]
MNIINISFIISSRRYITIFLIRQNQTCFDPSLAIIVYDSSSDPRRMSFQQIFPNFKISIDEKDEKSSNMKPDSNDAKLCPITDIDPSFRTITTQQSCAIIGDNGMLLNSKCGKEIDSHGFTFRADLTEEEGSIEDAGKRTDIMMLNRQTADFVYDTLFASSRTSQTKRNYAKLLQTVRYLNDSILWYLGSTAGVTAKKLQKIAVFFRSQKMSVRFGFSFTDVGAQTKRRWKTNKAASSRLILLTVAETLCKKITLYGFHSIYSNATKPESNVDKFKNEVKIIESLLEKGVLSQALNPC